MTSTWQLNYKIYSKSVAKTLNKWVCFNSISLAVVRLSLGCDQLAFCPLQIVDTTVTRCNVWEMPVYNKSTLQFVSMAALLHFMKKWVWSGLSKLWIDFPYKNIASHCIITVYLTFSLLHDDHRMRSNRSCIKHFIDQPNCLSSVCKTHHVTIQIVNMNISYISSI